jgi:hypothetical protein
LGPHGMGVKFRGMTEKDHQILKQYLTGISTGGKKK